MDFGGLSAIETAALVRAGSASARESVQACLARIGEADGSVGAFQLLRAERALAEADELDRRKDLDLLPLAGVPVAIKDSVAVAGEPTRHGSLATSAAPADADDELVRRLRDAGCIVVGKTRQPELAIWAFTESNHGVTRNPWDLSRTPGGSSGGAAAAVSSGMIPFAQASDGGGSIRIPAACCGLFGIRPGPGVVPIPGGLPAHWYGLSQWGPLATTVADAALMLDVMAGGRGLASPRPPLRPLRVALSLRSPAIGTHARREVRLAVEASADALRDAGHTVTVVDPPYPATLGLAFLHRFFAGIAHEATDLDVDMALLEPRTREMVRVGNWLKRRLPVRDSTAIAWRQRMNDWFADYDVLLSPTMARTAPVSGTWMGRSWPATLAAMAPIVPFTQAWNLADYPCAAVPAGVAQDGLPLSVQLVAPQGGEGTLLSVAVQLEQLRPWARLAPAFRRPTAPAIA
ncbi:MAG: amidase [Candidatus Dormibacteria bacterium]